MTTKQRITHFYFAIVTYGGSQTILCEESKDALVQKLDELASTTTDLEVSRVIKGVDLPIKRSFRVG